MAAGAWAAGHAALADEPSGRCSAAGWAAGPPSGSTRAVPWRWHPCGGAWRARHANVQGRIASGTGLVMGRSQRASDAAVVRSNRRRHVASGCSWPPVADDVWQRQCDPHDSGLCSADLHHVWQLPIKDAHRWAAVTNDIWHLHPAGCNAVQQLPAGATDACKQPTTCNRILLPASSIDAHQQPASTGRLQPTRAHGSVDARRFQRPR